jgi:hypothetical protein
MSETFSKVEVITGVARQRRFTTEQKLLVVNETLKPGHVAERSGYLKRLDQLRSRGRNVGWVVGSGAFAGNWPPPD